MSINRNRAKLKKAITSFNYRTIIFEIKYPRYWDDGIITYPKYKRGYKNPNKTLFKYQIRMYRSWKYNRRTKWK